MHIIIIKKVTLMKIISVYNLKSLDAYHLCAILLY